MTANPAADATPGQRFTDPDGGTWVLSDDDRDNDPWDVRRATGTWGGWHSQEEAENAGLIELVAEDDAHAAAWARESAAAGMIPAPLDPANPEHLRQVADVLGRMTPRSLGVVMTTLEGLLRGVRSLADRLDRERAEAEQTAKDQELAARAARDDALTVYGTSGEARVGLVLAGIRAERERQEAEK